MKFTTPNPDFSGIRAGVVFENGTGEAKTQSQIDELSSLGYTPEVTPEVKTKKPKE